MEFDETLMYKYSVYEAYLKTPGFGVNHAENKISDLSPVEEGAYRAYQEVKKEMIRKRIREVQLLPDKTVGF